MSAGRIAANGSPPVSGPTPLPPLRTGTISASAARGALRATSASLRSTSRLLTTVLARPTVLGTAVSARALLGHAARLLVTARGVGTLAASLGLFRPGEEPGELRDVREEMARLERLREALEQRIDREEEQRREADQATKRADRARRQDRTEERQREQLRREEHRRERREAGATGPGDLQRRA